MSITKKIYSALFIYILVLSSTANAEEIKKIGKFKDWETIVYKNGKEKVCFAQSKPVLQSPKKTERDSRIFVSFRPNEKIFNGIGFTISVDILRNLITEEKADKKKILLMFKDSYLLEKGMNEQKVQQKKGNIAVLHLNPCDDLAKANQIMKENNCSEILWVK